MYLQINFVSVYYFMQVLTSLLDRAHFKRSKRVFCVFPPFFIDCLETREFRKSTQKYPATNVNHDWNDCLARHGRWRVRRIFIYKSQDVWYPRCHTPADDISSGLLARFVRYTAQSRCRIDLDGGVNYLQDWQLCQPQCNSRRVCRQISLTILSLITLRRNNKEQNICN